MKTEIVINPNKKYNKQKNWWLSLTNKKREELAATLDKFPESLSYEDIEIIFSNQCAKAMENYDSLLSALKEIFQYDQENTWVGRTALKAIKKAEEL